MLNASQKYEEEKDKQDEIMRREITQQMQLKKESVKIMKDREVLECLMESRKERKERKGKVRHR